MGEAIKTTQKRTFISALKNKIKRSTAFGAICFFILFYAVMSIIKPAFLTMNNFRAILLAAEITVVVGFAQMVTMVGGGMNLAVGGIGGLSAVICASMMQDFGLSTPVAILIGLGVGVLTGALNGFLASMMGATPIMTWLITMALSYVYIGVQSAWNHALSYNELNDSFDKLGSATFLGFPLLVYVMLGIGILLFLLFRFTGLGRQFLAVGTNPQAAVMNGISLKKTVMLMHILSGLLAACAGLMLSMRVACATVDFGLQWGFFSFAAPIIGGTEGGKVSVLGTIVGGVILATIENALVHFGLDMYFTTLIRGCVILMAVAINTYRNAKRMKER